jgi:hypothetical protein
MGQIDGEGNPLDADDVATGIFVDPDEEEFEDPEEEEPEYEEEHEEEEKEKNDLINKFLRF